MAKIYGLFGSMTGKLADTVMSVRNGEQIARKYQPVVFNPSTPAQVAQRAKLKLLSQLSAVLAPAIAIRRQGNVSSRNLFTKKNFPAVSYANNTADINLASVQLTDSVVGLPALSLTRSAGSVDVALVFSDPDINHMVYVVAIKDGDDKLRFHTSAVVNKDNTNTFSTTISVPDYDIVVYGYGIRVNTENARAIFGNLVAPGAETVAKLIVTRTLTENDVTLTETRGTESSPGSAKVSSKSSK